MVIRIKNNHAEISVSGDEAEPSDEINAGVKLAVWFLSRYARMVSLKAITLVFEPDESDEQSCG